jgi:DNA phosphorothioation-dependent restriction protein DptG
MEFKAIDTAQIESSINAFVDQIEKSTSSVLSMVQPESVRAPLVSLNKAYFDFARTNMVTAKTFGLVIEKATKDFAKNTEKATKVA